MKVNHFDSKSKRILNLPPDFSWSNPIIVLIVFMWLFWTSSSKSHVSWLSL